MNFKIDTKEKFHVITLQESETSAIMTAELQAMMHEITEKPINHVVLNLVNLIKIDENFARFLVQQQEAAALDNRSFVVCCLFSSVKAYLDDLECLDVINHTPTESEAWDIVQMEEIERELLNGEE